MTADPLPQPGSSQSSPTSASTVSDPGSSSVSPPSRTTASACPASRPRRHRRHLHADHAIVVHRGEQRSVGDLRQRLPGAHRKRGVDDEQRLPRRRGRVGPGQAVRRSGIRLHPNQDGHALGPPARRQAGDIADPLVIELPHRFPGTRLGAKADLSERVSPPILEGGGVPLVRGIASPAASRCERTRRGELREGSRRAAPHDEVHHERIVLVPAHAERVDVASERRHTGRDRIERPARVGAKAQSSEKLGYRPVRSRR